MREDVHSRFLQDVKNHKCTIIRDDGVDRHVRFRKPGTICYGFDLITWPGHLCVTGDCGTYVFKRTFDMFEFFISGSSKKYPINTGYWAEKLLSVDRHGDVKRFSQEKFNKAVWADFIEFAKHGEHTPEKIREIRWEIEEDILNADNEHDAYNSLFSYSNHGFRFDDFFEHDCTEYTYHYVWNLFAIVWGIAKYEKTFTDAMREMNMC